MKKFNKIIDRMNEDWVGIYWRAMILVVILLLSVRGSFVPPFEVSTTFKIVLMFVLYGCGLIALYSTIRVIYQRFK